MNPAPATVATPSYLAGIWKADPVHSEIAFSVRLLMARGRPPALLAVSEFGQLGTRRHDPHTARTEIHDQGCASLDPDDPAEAVLIVGNLIPHCELLSRRSGIWRTERAGGQEAPGRGAGWFHHYQYAPCRPYAPARPLGTGCAGRTLTIWSSHAEISR
jgi:hypothetical protein